MQPTNKFKSFVVNAKRLMTMDFVILAIILFMSSLWGVVFNSLDNPMENQPIDFVIDVERNVSNLAGFFGYFIQFFAIYFSGYLIYWINHHVLINQVMVRFGVFIYFVLTICFTFVAVPTLSQLALMMPINSSEFTLLPSGNKDPFDYWNYYIAALILIFSTPIILSFKWLKQRAEVAELQQQHVQTELRLLQQQINPHFLFNTLNNLYSLTLVKSEQAPQAILQLSNLLRFVVYQGSKTKVSLQDELQYLSNYIELQNIRVQHRTKINFNVANSVTEQAANLAITPLMLIMLLENAFKHGVDKTDLPSSINFELSLNEKELQVKCVNSIDPRAVGESSEQGLGIDNLSRRLELVYPNKHTFSTVKKDQQFTAELTLELNDYE